MHPDPIALITTNLKQKMAYVSESFSLRWIEQIHPDKHESMIKQGYNSSQ